MILKKIEIKNYRQFKHSKINFENDITVLAGANNSGKTSLIELFKNILSNTRCKLGINDLPVHYANRKARQIYSIASQLIDEEKSVEEFINDLTNLFKNVSYNENIVGTYVNMEITYKESEDISEFSDYLMDLRKDVFSFYFRFEYTYKLPNLFKIIKSKYNIFAQEILEINNKSSCSTEKSESKEKLQIRLLEYFLEAFEPTYYFTDSTFKNKVKMERKSFIRLFNFHCINANKRLTDQETNRDLSISKEMVDFISNDKDWDSLMKNLPSELRSLIEDNDVKKKIQEKSLKGLEKAIDKISKTSGRRKTVMNLDLDINENSILNFIKEITKAQYIMEGFALDENAQGLGYSNLILIHLRLESFVQDYDPKLVNIFIIEEPEAHMHPQMQKIFIEYLYEYYRGENIQGLITTHSQEIIRVTEMEKIRVIRENGFLVNNVYDLRHFSECIDNGETGVRRFYNLFFNLNLSDLIFADRAILYEGDTERMYIQSLLSNTDGLETNKFEDLSNLYIAFVQVGGAHAHRYQEILNFLQIKTVIFTDIDYEKESLSITEILDSSVTNSSLNYFYKQEENIDKKPNVCELISWVKDRESELINIKFQGPYDNFGRTLEESMITKLLDKKVCFTENQSYWNQLKGDTKLEFSIPRRSENISVRDIVNSTGKSKKTDFMYSVINEEMCNSMLPNYIEEGLRWLQN